MIRGVHAYARRFIVGAENHVELHMFGPNEA